jgi:hypothetical protein
MVSTKPLWADRLPYPDHPVKLFARSLPELEKTRKYVIQEKLDGFYLLIFRTGEDWRFLSRQLTETIPVSGKMKKELQSLKIPKWSLVGSEWSKRRTKYAGPEMVSLFTAIAWDGELLRDVGEKERIEPILGLGLSDEWMRAPVRRCRLVYENFVEFFEETQNHPETEGVVLKDLKAPLILSRKKRVDNPAHIRMHWRSGEDGQSRQKGYLDK